MSDHKQRSGVDLQCRPPEPHETRTLPVVDYPLSQVYVLVFDSQTGCDAATGDWIVQRSPGSL